MDLYEFNLLIPTCEIMARRYNLLIRRKKVATTLPTYCRHRISDLVPSHQLSNMIFKLARGLTIIR